MRSTLEAVLFAAAVVAGACAVSYCASGCSGSALKSREADAVYAAEQLRCVDQSATREEANTCRVAVRERWGIHETVRDAGGDHD